MLVSTKSIWRGFSFKDRTKLGVKIFAARRLQGHGLIQGCFVRVQFRLLLDHGKCEWSEHNINNSLSPSKWSLIVHLSNSRKCPYLLVLLIILRYSPLHIDQMDKLDFSAPRHERMVFTIRSSTTHMCMYVRYLYWNYCAFARVIFAQFRWQW